jgi:uncharacterized RDD family membrane protein YckC
VEDYQDRLVIATPEGVELALDLAGLGSRFTAGLIDLLIKTLIAAALLVAAIPLGGVIAVVVEAGVPLLVYIGYDVLFETLGSGRTPGKRWSGLRVMRADGGPEDLVASLVRNVLRLIDGLPLSYLPGIASILLTRRNQRLGDLAAGTIVVRERRGGRRAGEPGADAALRPAATARPARDEPAAEAGAAGAPVGSAPAGAPVGSAPAGAPVGSAPAGAPAARDLGGLRDEDLAAVRAFLHRRESLDAGARADVARRLAASLRPKVAGPFDGLSPERFLEALDEARRRS